MDSKITISRRTVLGYVSGVIILTPISAKAFWPALLSFVRIAAPRLIRVPGIASRGLGRNAALRASRQYHPSPSPLAQQLAAEGRAIRQARLRAQEREELKLALRVGEGDYRYVRSDDRRKLISNMESVIDSIDTFNDIRDLMEFIQKFDNIYEAVFTLSRDELESNSRLAEQYSLITDGIDWEYAQLLYDENLEATLRRLRNPFISF